MAWIIPDDATILEVVRGANTLTLPAPWCKVVNFGSTMAPGPLRGADLELWGAGGSLPRQHFQGAATYRLRLILCGDVLYDGSTPSSERVGMKANVAWLQSFCEPITASPYTLAATLTRPVADEVGAAVRLSLVIEDDDLQSTWGRCTLLVDVPAGKWA